MLGIDLVMTIICKCIDHINTKHRLDGWLHAILTKVYADFFLVD